MGIAPEFVKRVAQPYAGIRAQAPRDALADVVPRTLSELLGVAWQVVEERKVTRWEARVEHYLVGPPVEPNSKNWQTEIAILVGSGQALPSGGNW